MHSPANNRRSPSRYTRTKDALMIRIVSPAFISMIIAMGFVILAISKTKNAITNWVIDPALIAMVTALGFVVFVLFMAIHIVLLSVSIAFLFIPIIVLGALLFFGFLKTEESIITGLAITAIAEIALWFILRDKSEKQRLNS